MPHPKKLPEFEVSITSSTRAVRDALKQVLIRLEPLVLDPEETSTVELILAEALNNIVEHAYPVADTSGPIYIRCDQKTDGLHFRIRDNGRAMPDGQVPVGRIQPCDLETSDLPEGGFGWFLIEDLAKDTRYSRNGQENQLDLRIAVAYGQTG